MIFNKYARALASAALLAIAIASVPVGFVQAMPYTKESCEGEGHVWVEGKGCADKTCSLGGRTEYVHGQTVTSTASTGRVDVRVCNGFTGQWELQRTADPQGPLNPQAPRPTTNGR